MSISLMALVVSLFQFHQVHVRLVVLSWDRVSAQEFVVTGKKHTPAVPGPV
jgi:hypothetical protein